MNALTPSTPAPSTPAQSIGTAPAIAAADLLRLEGLGDNCEFGFVLRQLGFEGGGLFRWAAMPPECLLATLRGDFQGIYDFDNLVPQNGKMVRDLRYGTCWHTAMRSVREAGTLRFLAEEAERRDIHAREAGKLAYLVEKFRQKCLQPDPVFVLKCNTGVPEDMLEAIHYQLYRRVPSRDFTLLEVRADPGRAGSVEAVDRNLLRGYLARFADYDTSDDSDFDTWVRMLAAALCHRRETGGHTVEAMELPFPLAPVPALTSVIDGDVRAGVPSLSGGNSWCRPHDEGYRLHATAAGAQASALCWTGVHAPAGWTLALQAALAVADALPVRACLSVTDADGRVLRRTTTIASLERHDLALALPAQLRTPLTVRLTAEPEQVLQNGEYAVIDLSPLRIAPG